MFFEAIIEKGIKDRKVARYTCGCMFEIANPALSVPTHCPHCGKGIMDVPTQMAQQGPAHPGDTIRLPDVKPETLEKAREEISKLAGTERWRYLNQGLWEQTAEDGEAAALAQMLMDLRQYNPPYFEMISNIIKTHLKKAHDYAKSGDPYSNFRHSAAIAGVDPLTVFLVMIGVKIARLNSLYSEGKEPNNESIEDTWLDLANYAIIGAAFVAGGRSMIDCGKATGVPAEIIEALVETEVKREDS